ncbi:MAG: hypothetical protein JNJ48_07305 [Phycisphaerae bacterium]|nr:hypothetical protein [Phycisphaerae bacterium]
MHLPPSVTIEPGASRWSELLALGAARRGGPWAESRRSLGLPSDRPVILSGHQAAVWHAGIAAKWFALHHSCARFNTAGAWLVVDQDPEDFTAVRFPLLLAGTVGQGVWRCAPDTVATRLRADEPPALIGPFSPMALPPAARGADAAVLAGLEALQGALRLHSTATTAAEQVARAVSALLRPHCPEPPLIMATTLGRTAMFGAMLDDMRRDPAACVRAYNAAVAGAPGAHLRPLTADEPRGRYELPLWRLTPGLARRRVYSPDLASVPAGELAPRALLMTALLRRGVCDLFIHGLGGAGSDGASGYDAAAEAWVRAWLGVELAPAVLATGTLLADLGRTPRTDRREADRAAWLAHRARHDPAVVGDGASAERKRALVAEIARQRDRRLRRERYDELQRLLAQVRERHSGQVAALAAAARGAAERLRDDALLLDRTWPVPVHSAERLGALGALVGARLAG